MNPELLSLNPSLSSLLYIHAPTSQRLSFGFVTSGVVFNPLLLSRFSYMVLPWIGTTRLTSLPMCFK